MKNKRNKINRHNGSYNRAVTYALQAIYDGTELVVDGQEFSYDKQLNELTIKDYCTTSIYKPEFNGMFCNPFKELVRQEVN